MNQYTFFFSIHITTSIHLSPEISRSAPFFTRQEPKGWLMSVGMVTPVVAGGHIKDILIIQSPEIHFNDTGGFVPVEGGNKAARQSFS